MSGPVCTVLLADLGPDVIKVESLEGDIVRRTGGHHRNGVAGLFLALYRGKRSVSVVDTWCGPGAAASADGYVVHLAVSAREMHGVLSAIGRADLSEDDRFATLEACLATTAAFDDVVTAGFATEPTADLVGRLRRYGVAASAVLDADQVVADADLTGGDFFVEWEHPVAGRVRQVRPPIRFDRERRAVTPSARVAGAHNDELLPTLVVPGAGGSDQTVRQRVQGTRRV